MGRLRTPFGRLRTPLCHLRTPLGRLRTPLGASQDPIGGVSGPLWVVSGLVGSTWGDLGLASAGPLQVVCRTSRDPLGSTLDEQDPLGSTSGLASVGPLQVVFRTIRTHLGLLWMSRTHLGRCSLGLNIVWSGSNPLPKLTKPQTVKTRTPLETTASQTVEPWIRMWLNWS